MKKVHFTEADLAIQLIKEETTAVLYLQKLFKKQEEKGIPLSERKAPEGMRQAVPHILLTGPAGVGKTRRAYEIAKVMGVKEGIAFFKLGPTSFDTIEELIEFIHEKISWDGYLCDHGHIKHTIESGCVCPSTGRRLCKIVDPETPKGPVKPFALFMDEIHLLPKKLHDQLGIILLERYYVAKTDRGPKKIYFPYFTFMAATTDPGRLSPALESRFKRRVPLEYYTDEEMLEVVTKMMGDHHNMQMTEAAKEIIARCAQGVPRNAENLMDSLYVHWINGLVTGKLNQTEHKIIDEKLVGDFVYKLKYTVEGFQFRQIDLLKFLAVGNIDPKTGKQRGVGVKKILSRFGCDLIDFLRSWEPILQRKALITCGSRGREATPAGVEFLSKLANKYSNMGWNVEEKQESVVVL